MSDPAVEAAQRAWNSEGWGCNPLELSEGNLAMAAAREALAPLRAIHYKTEVTVRSATSNFQAHTEYACAGCGDGFESWPCESARLIYPDGDL